MSIWIIPTIIAYTIALPLSRSRIRAIDILGTTIFAEAPYIVTIVCLAIIKRLRYSSIFFGSADNFYQYTLNTEVNAELILLGLVSLIIFILTIASFLLIIIGIFRL